jgi:hypothetical protein
VNVIITVLKTLNLIFPSVTSGTSSSKPETYMTSLVGFSFQPK